VMREREAAELRVRGKIRMYERGLKILGNIVSDRIRLDE
jgi:hypothetical protein